eukprot:CAMPEP_0118948606 /NCGR_PEP_ID=MMETSP1169-20130426/48147_1 /TAXON_ID=36882 /ORGANISM="Pyramimonas obovata, Strain CCMP722" /LENGTH=66 /DNA_ID=CAMNT_0006895087 /DNA_START=221 /DNA_END=418 /DNA_ORIENTATION=-
MTTLGDDRDSLPASALATVSPPPAASTLMPRGGGSRAAASWSRVPAARLAGAVPAAPPPIGCAQSP